MNLFINAINLSSAGGLNVTLNFLKGLSEHRPGQMKIYVAAPRNCGYEALETSFMQLIWLPNGANYWVSRFFTDYIWIPLLINRIKPDIVFTMGNFATPTQIRQVVLLHYPHPAYPNEEEVWKRLDTFGMLNVWIRNCVFSQRMKYVDVLLVQTVAMKNRIMQVYPSLPSIRLFPNAYTQLDSQTDYQLPFVRENNVRYLLCLSRYYPHKNIEILADVATLIRDRNLPYRILLTIESGQHRKARRLLERIRIDRLNDIIINIGNVPTNGVPSLYKQVDGIVLPTLLESFTATYVDAMHFRVPIFTSRRDFSAEICGECAYYFDPLSAEDILATIEAGFCHSALMQKKIITGELRSRSMPDWPAVTQIGLSIIESLCMSTPNALIQ